MSLQEVWQSFLDIIYPRDIRCPICGVKRDDMLSWGVCQSCQSRLPFIEPPICPKCGRMMLIDNRLCLDCQQANHAFYKGISIFEFSTEVKGLIHRYKYRGEKHLSIPMIHWMMEGLKVYRWDFDIIVPVPLHPSRERQRGFNQAKILAQGLSKNTDIPLDSKSLIRVKNTPHQTKLNRQERKRNLQYAFRVKETDGKLKVFQDKVILLVDDVYTTGSTADQCSRVLLDSGASKVYLITLATGANF
ncbi:MAG: ComF family protein [Clostridiales bacterium]|nr:ComF family protein [Clostridiales bacterium]